LFSSNPVGLYNGELHITLPIVLIISILFWQLVRFSSSSDKVKA